MPFVIVNLLAAMGAGVFGVAIGALTSFVFVGILILVGVAIMASTGAADFLGAVPFAVFGPHVAGWACGVAGAAWAAKNGKLASGRDIATVGMGWNSPAALAVGALFGAIGYVINWALNQVGVPWTDTVALTVVISAIITRLAFGKAGLFGKPPAGQSRFATPPESSKWLPWQNSPGQLVLIGLGAGLMSAYIALTVGPAKGGVFIGFALSGISLVLFHLSSKVPVTHHITLTSAVAAAASGSLIWGAAFGLLAAFVGEFFSRLWLIYGDTHIDPPACAIATLTSLSLLLSALGVYTALVLP